MKPKGTILVFGTFDIIHPGHMDFFRQAKQYGDKLIVVVARDYNVKKIKGRNSNFSEKKRLKNVAELPLVDKAFLGYKHNRFKIIKELKPDVICLGYDQDFQEDFLETELQKMDLKVKIYRLRPFRPEIYKSSKYKTPNDKFNCQYEASHRHLQPRQTKRIHKRLKWIIV